jgi:predicted AAA+ superfamily ATPase
MIPRDIAAKTLSYAGQYPVVMITGPRQSGKTTLCQMLFKSKAYVSLEDIDARQYAQNDPRGFLNQFPKGAVLDEIQRVPDLMSYIQTIVDEKQEASFYILTGSQQFDLLQNISQSLAGRTALVRLLPFTMTEAYADSLKDVSLNRVLHTGFYPRIFNQNLDAADAMMFYVNTYVERDLRMLINVKDLSTFEIFLKLCAGRIGHVVNLSSLGNDCGVNHKTIKNWLSVLEASYIIKILRPFYQNFNKRLIKSPKLYFLDSGLASFLLGIENEKQMETHPSKGALFESLVVSEILKQRFNQGQTDNLYFFRDNTGNEVDLVCDFGQIVDLVEVKLGQTVAGDFFKGIRYFQKLSADIRQSYVVYGGDGSYTRENTRVISWRDLPGFTQPINI